MSYVFCFLCIRFLVSSVCLSRVCRVQHLSVQGRLLKKQFQLHPFQRYDQHMNLISFSFDYFCQNNIIICFLYVLMQGYVYWYTKIEYVVIQDNTLQIRSVHKSWPIQPKQNLDFQTKPSAEMDFSIMSNPIPFLLIPPSNFDFIFHTKILIVY